MKRMKSLTIILIVIFLGFLYHRYFREQTPVEKKSAPDEKQLKITPQKVRVKNAFRGELVKYITASGVTEAAQEVQIKPLISGKVKRVLVQDGQKVKKGELLLEIDDREYQFALEEARGNLLKAQMNYAIRKKDNRQEPNPDTSLTSFPFREKYLKAKAEYEQGIINKSELNRIKREYEIALILAGKKQDDIIAQESGLTAAEARFERAKYQLENCQIRAPFAGIVAAVSVNAGDMVFIGEPLMQLVDLNLIKLRLQVLESDIGNLKENEVIQARFSAFPETTFPGRIIGINPVINPDSRSCTVVALLKNPDFLLKSGMFATAKLVVNRYPNRLLVPREAVIVRDQKKLVFIVREEKAFWCYVNTGLENDEYIEINDSAFDLKAGEPVIVEGHFALAHNAPVEIVE
ncbi:MAG: efflux RND transporter periplasmic adaptor subunit [Calditrichia bacterium]